MPKITLILHNIRSTHNVGSIFRSAEGFGVREIIMTGYTPYPDLTLTSTAPTCAYENVSELSDPRLPHIREKITNQIHKTALGAESLVPFTYFEQLETWLDYNHDTQKLPLLALEQADNSINLRDYDAPAEFALLLGEEVHGIEDEYLAQCDSILEIPMSGQKESFNVSVTTGIALFALTK